MKIKKTAVLILSFLFILSAGAMFYFRTAMRPTVLSMAKNAARSEMTLAINSAVAEELKNDASAFAELIAVEYGEDKTVASVNTDSGRVNALKSRLSVLIAKELSEMKGKSFAIPLGNLINTDFFSGKGACVNVKVLSVGAVTTDFETEFSSCAINQTHYKLMLKVNAVLTVYVPFSHETIDVTTGICISDTVIVGGVPEAYTYVDESGNGSVNGIAGTLNDYGAVVD